MTFNLRIGLIFVSLLLFIIVLVILKKGRMPIKYSLIWISSGFIIILVSIIPNLFVWLSKILGFDLMSNFIIGLFIFILLLITISLTVIVSGQNKKIILLIQEISILKSKLNKK